MKLVVELFTKYRQKRCLPVSSPAIMPCVGQCIQAANESFHSTCLH